MKRHAGERESPTTRRGRRTLATLLTAALTLFAGCGGGAGDAQEDALTPANEAPTVDIDAPLGGAYAQGSTVLLTATALDSDGIVQRVEFFDATTKLGEDTTAPFEFSWSGAGVGMHTLTAHAIDDDGAVAVSAALEITVTAAPGPVPPNLPPVVSLTAPVSNFKPDAPATLTLAASAADVDGTIASVAFYRIDPARPVFDATTLVGAALVEAPYEQTTPALAAGTYTFAARATDNDGAVATSDSVQVTVNALPTVALTAPAANATVPVGSSLTLRATASDADGSIAKLEFFDGTSLLGEGLRTAGSNDYTFTWVNVSAGAKTLTAVATDNDGATQSTASVTVNANGPPTVTLDAPQAGTNVPTQLTLSASATDADGSIASVQFFNGNTLLGAGVFNATSRRYGLTVPVTAAGTYNITARATDNSGGSATSASRSVTIAANVAPTVRMTSATSFALTAGSVILSATAADTDGIARVEFYSGSTKLGEDTTAPYTHTWTAPPVGTYSITARAFDWVGNSATSAVQSVRITATPAAGTFSHGGGVLSLADLQTLKSHIAQGRQPWKSGFDLMAQDGRARLTYTMAGPLAKVSRSPNLNLGAWRNDMVAVWHLSRMWYFTGDEAYAQKARQILLAWANTQTEFSGRESMLDLGDFAYQFVGGASILRSTWSGWAEADTTAVKRYFSNVLMPASNPYGDSMYGAANKGALALNALGLMAIFNDDAATLDRVVYQLRTLPHIGLRNSNDIGLLGDSLRDQGHAHGHLLALVMLAEALWKQGIDVYADLDNRLLAAGEYFSRVNELAPTPFLPFGTTDAYYIADNTNRGWPGGSIAPHLIHTAYALRKGLPAPFSAQRRARIPVDADSFMFVKESDASRATAPAALPIPPTSPVTTGWSTVNIGGAAPAGSASYAAGTWTVRGAGTDIWGTNDSCLFVYRALTGNSTIIAKVESIGNTSIAAKAGVMMRTSLTAGAPRAWMAVTNRLQAEQNMPNLAVYGGSNYGNKALNLGVATPSYWVKLERIGSIITGYISPDGTNWAATNVGRINAPVPDTLYVGLVVTSQVNGTLNTSTFSHVQITGGDGGGPRTTPAAPAALLAAPGDAAVALRWQPSAGASSYTVLRSTSQTGTYTAIATGVTGSSYTDRAVTNGTTYYYAVTASNTAGTSGRSAVDSATPVRDWVNIAAGGTASDSVNNPANAANGFDRNSGTQWVVSGTSGWLRYELSAPASVLRYSVISTNGPAGRDPRAWQFQGSNDGVAWTTLDTQANQSFATRQQLRSYAVAAAAPYRHYRLNISANNGDASFTSLSDLALLVARSP